MDNIDRYNCPLTFRWILLLGSTGRGLTSGSEVGKGNNLFPQIFTFRVTVCCLCHSAESHCSC
jgi:hypothetical protein